MKFSRSLFFFSVVKADVELVGQSWHKGSGGVEVQQSDSADIVGRGVLIEHGKLKVKLRACLDRNVQGFVPNNLDVFVSIDYLSLVLSSAVASEDLDPNKVLHLTVDVVTLLEDGVGNGYLQAGHAQQNILCNIIYWVDKGGEIIGEDREDNGGWFEKKRRLA